jgi:hypothetical protein
LTEHVILTFFEIAGATSMAALVVVCSTATLLYAAEVTIASITNPIVVRVFLTTIAVQGTIVVTVYCNPVGAGFVTGCAVAVTIIQDAVTVAVGF